MALNEPLMGLKWGLTKGVLINGSSPILVIIILATVFLKTEYCQDEDTKKEKFKIKCGNKTWIYDSQHLCKISEYFRGNY